MQRTFLPFSPYFIVHKCDFIANNRLLMSCSFFISQFTTDMRRDVQEIFKMTPHEKQVMMFSATLAKEIRPVCKKFMNNVIPHSSCSARAAAA